MTPFLTIGQLQQLIESLRGEGYDVIGPRIDQGAILYDQIESVADLPKGWTDEQAPGHYRLRQRGDEEHFGYNVGPHSWKKFLFPPHVTVLKSQKSAEGWNFSAPEAEPPKLALLGVRACELAAIAIQDRVFMGGAHVDPIYAERRERLFLIAVNCTQAAATCFCVSMDTGPRCKSGFDLALTEIDDGFVVETGSERGAALLQRIATRPSTGHEDVQSEARRTKATVQQRSIDREEVHDLLLANLQHPHWKDVADRCLSCANCTMVCPTCFCSSVEEVSDLAGENIERQRHWESCFNLGFSYLNGGAVRPDIRSRYRQWLTHKLATWIDQFGSSGCVGCGRCIAWCPVGIDLTQEVVALREAPR
jgi:sulfhydrogenase subunit beta (sulfur reductase)